MSDAALINLGETTESRADFVEFLGALHKDYLVNGAQWENSTLSHFLEALTAWSKDCSSYYKNLGLSVDPDQPQWRVFADMLLAARVYE